MATASKTYDNFASVSPYKIWPGVLAHAVQGESLSFALVELEPNVEVAEHSHPNEQAGFILRAPSSSRSGVRRECSSQATPTSSRAE